jgi:hypothetical protein
MLRLSALTQEQEYSANHDHSLSLNIPHHARPTGNYAARTHPLNRHTPAPGRVVTHDKAGGLFDQGGGKRRSATNQRPQSSSASRFTADAFGFSTFTQCGGRDEKSFPRRVRHAV